MDAVNWVVETAAHSSFSNRFTHVMWAIITIALILWILNIEPKTYFAVAVIFVWWFFRAKWKEEEEEVPRGASGREDEQDWRWSNSYPAC